MLKIKDNVDLKELEKFGFEIDFFYNYYLNENGNIIKIDRERDNRIFIYAENEFEHLETVTTPLHNVIYDLIKADMVEKV